MAHKFPPAPDVSHLDRITRLHRFPPGRSSPVTRRTFRCRCRHASCSGSQVQSGPSRATASIDRAGAKTLPEPPQGSVSNRHAVFCRTARPPGANVFRRSDFPSSGSRNTAQWCTAKYSSLRLTSHSGDQAHRPLGSAVRSLGPSVGDVVPVSGA